MQYVIQGLCIIPTIPTIWAPYLISNQKIINNYYFKQDKNNILQNNLNLNYIAIIPVIMTVDQITDIIKYLYITYFYSYNLF